MEPKGGFLFQEIIDFQERGKMKNKGSKNEVSVMEACIGTFIGTLIAVLASVIFYHLSADIEFYLRVLIALDLGAMAGASVGLFVGRAGYNERKRIQKRRERRALRDFEGYKNYLREQRRISNQ